MNPLVGIGLLISLLLGLLYIGTYSTSDGVVRQRHFFIKHFPTVQFSFSHALTRPNQGKTLHTLSDEERQQIIIYCHYRWGIQTQLHTPAELERCTR